MAALKTYQSRMLVLLTQQELLIAEIYRFFSILFPETRDFWDQAAKEEMEHAGWVEYFYAKAQTAEVFFREEQMKTYTVESFVKYLEDNLAKVKQKAPTPQAAFALSLSIENSLIVKKLFTRFQSDNQELTILLRRLQDDLSAHRGRIEKMAATLTPR